MTMSEREQKLEAALRLALEYWGHRQQRYKNRHPVWVKTANDALSTRSTSEWNDAVEEVADACRMHLGEGIYNSIDGAKCVKIIESFKRKEQS